VLVYKTNNTTKDQKRKGNLLGVKLFKKGQKVTLDTSSLNVL